MLQQAWEGWETLRSLPLVLLAVLAAPAALAAWAKRIAPHTPLLVLLGAACLISLGVLVWTDAVLVLAAADAALVVAAAADVLTLPRRGQLEAERRAARAASLRGRHSVELAVANRGGRPVELWVRDGLPQQFDASPEQFHVRLAPGRRAVFRYRFRSRRRGAFRLERVHVRARSRLGLWVRYLRVPAASDIHVYPDMQQLARYELLARTNRLSLLGVRRARRIGQDNEFERLRDYTLDDNYKHIDWRATARRVKLTVRDFQTSQSQRVVFLVDCGRMMTNEAAGLSLLDHALNAVLMLGFVALRQGDAVGLACFSDRIHTYVPPRGGMRQMNHLLHAAFDQFPELVESRYDLAFVHLASHCQKRALVVLVTNVVDEVNAAQVRQYLGNLAGRHLPLGVLLRDRRLFEPLEAARLEGPALFRAAAAADVLGWRRQVLADLEHSGVLTIDAFPESLTAPLVNRYLEIKARHLL